MGAWGYYPFQNDWVLDDLGYFCYCGEIESNLLNGLNKDNIYYAGYEYTALLVSTYKEAIKKRFVIDEDTALKIMKTLDRDVLTNEQKELFTESSKMWISACSIPLAERKQLLIKCANKLKEEIDNPKTGNEYFEKDRFILSMKHVYTTAMEILNSVDNKPLFIETKRLSKLMGAYSKPSLTLSNNINEADKMYIFTYDYNKLRHVIKNRNTGNKYTVTEEELIKLIKNGKIEEPDSYMCMENLRQYFEKPKKNMLTISCIGKVYNHNRIIAYDIQDEHGKVTTVASKELKEAIRSGKVNCINLTLTSNNRLISK